MTIAIDIPKAAFLRSVSNNLLITQSNPCWQVTAKDLLKVAPLILRTNRCVIHALGYQSVGGLFTPSLKLVDKVFKSLRFFPSSESSLIGLCETKLMEESRLVLKEDPFSIVHQTKKSAHVLTTDLAIALDICVLPSPAYPIKGDDILDPIKEIFSSPETAFSKYQTRFPAGTAQKVTLELIQNLARDFFTSFSDFENFASSSSELRGFDSISGRQLILRKTGGVMSIYPVLSEFNWKGTYKTVVLALKINSTITPVGISITADKIEAKTEIAFRQHPELSKVLPPLEFFWDCTDQLNLSHGWASMGTFAEVCKKVIPIEVKDLLAIQLLKKMELFHQYACHKDLNPRNVVVDFSNDTWTLWINDVGLSCLKDDAAQITLVATNSYNLAPEILKEVIPLRGHFWSAAFDHPITALQWEYNERFMVGQMLCELYLGERLFPLLPGYAEILSEIQKKYQITAMAFESLTLTQKYKLDQYFSAERFKQIKEVYRISYKNICKKIEYTEDDEENFSEIFEDPNRRIILEAGISLEDKAQIYKLYALAHNKMKMEYVKEEYAALAHVISTIDKPICELIPKLKTETSGRLKIFSLLLDLEPSKRPSFTQILTIIEKQLSKPELECTIC